MIGYHYTSWSHWQQIKKEGLSPYLISKEELYRELHFYPRGIWLWKRQLTEEEHVGSILYQATTKAELKVVHLKVEYSDRFTLRFQGRNVQVSHDGSIGNWIYHRRTPSVIVTKAIPPGAIKLIKTYDIEAMLL